MFLLKQNKNYARERTQLMSLCGQSLKGKTLNSLRKWLSSWFCALVGNWWWKLEIEHVPMFPKKLNYTFVAENSKSRQKIEENKYFVRQTWTLTFLRLPLCVCSWMWTWNQHSSCLCENLWQAWGSANEYCETSGSRNVWSREGPGGASGSGVAVKLEASKLASMPEQITTVGQMFLIIIC